MKIERYLFFSVLHVLLCIAATAQTRRVCMDSIPEGTYAVSVTKGIHDSNADTATILSQLERLTALEVEELRQSVTGKVPGYETEQTVHGYVKGTWKKIKKPQLHIFVPATGYKDTFDLEGKQSFTLSGLDITEGTEFVLQVTRPQGSDNFINLHVVDPVYPDISVARFLRKEECAAEEVTDTIEEEKDIYRIEVLPEIITKGSKFKPMNAYGMMPERGYGINNPFLKEAKTMQQLLFRLGLSVKTIDLHLLPFKYKNVNHGWYTAIEPVVPTVYVNDIRLESYDDIEEIWNIRPDGIRQIEYFTDAQTEARLPYKANEAGALLIYTKPYAAEGQRSSMAVVRQLGYRPQHTFHPETAHGNTVLWQPSLRVGSDGKAEIVFEAKEGYPYTIILEGISDKGELVRREVEL